MGSDRPYGPPRRDGIITATTDMNIIHIYMQVKLYTRDYTEICIHVYACIFVLHVKVINCYA